MTRNTTGAGRRLARFGAGLVLGVTALLSGCIGRTSTNGVARPSTTWVVHIKDFRFQPAQLTVNVGDLVVWVNDDAFRHSATADNVAWASGELEREKRWSWMPEHPGQHQYHCSAHPTMRATLTVQARPRP